jgi:hypothetical protein
MMFGSRVLALLRLDDVAGLTVADPRVVEAPAVDCPGLEAPGTAMETLSLGPACTAGRVDDAAVDKESTFDCDVD